eukprot:CAMPEP_0178535112 /NCGR_PEP_ID=MMETSP0696-20121128/35378_1 /TAXON_ID=265572 /ORGANISM="Extubocellulus spinifer, Strain CCMP396" /LENGTH=80 /DNA_ID=CAMNT_0020167243 /DNA_START=38 /DNA_END=281 /DNA_ORIENTATION=+
MAAPLLQDLKAQSGSGHSVIPRYCDVSSPLPAYPEDIERWRGKAAKNGDKAGDDVAGVVFAMLRLPDPLHVQRYQPMSSS